MQKKLIALAVAGLASTAAFAQSNVTVYGVVDAAFARQTVDGSQTRLLVNGGQLAASRLGFKGVEDLGGGLKALFALEYRLDIDGNNAIGSGAGVAGPARQQLLGLTGDFGTAVAGRLQTTGYDWALKFDVLAGTGFSPLQNVNAANFKIGGTAGHARANNAVAYISPSFSGLTLAANYAFAAEESADNLSNSNKVTALLLSATYENGPFAVGAVYDKQSGTLRAGLATVGNTAAAILAAGNVTPAGATNTTDWGLGASYNFGIAKLFATYQTTKNNDGAPVAATGQDFGAQDKAWSLGVAAPVSAAGTVIVSYAKNALESAKTPLVVGSTNAADTRAWTLAYTHGLSKRTTAYVGYNSINQEYTTAFGPLTTTPGANNIKTGTFVGGLNHKF